MTNEERILKKLEHIERLVRDLLKEKRVRKETWVKAATIMEVTSWNTSARLRAARNNAWVKVKKDNGYWYCLESINDVFMIEKPA